MTARLEAFREVNARETRLSWDERKKLIHEQFPSTHSLDWERALSEDMVVSILRDVLKADAATPGRPGPRPALEYKPGVERLRQLMGQDFTVLPFAEAFAILVGRRSLTSVARKTGLSKTVVHRFLKGERQPSREQLESIARGFKKHPSYFVEYRTAALVDLIERRLSEDPENAIAFYRQAFFGVRSGR